MTPRQGMALPPPPLQGVAPPLLPCTPAPRRKQQPSTPAAPLPPTPLTRARYAPPMVSCFSSPVARSTLTRVMSTGALHHSRQPHSIEQQPGSGLSYLNSLQQHTGRDQAWLTLATSMNNDTEDVIRNTERVTRRVPVHRHTTTARRNIWPGSHWTRQCALLQAGLILDAPHVATLHTFGLIQASYTLYASPEASRKRRRNGRRPEQEGNGFGEKGSTCWVKR